MSRNAERAKNHAIVAALAAMPTEARPVLNLRDVTRTGPRSWTCGRATIVATGSAPWVELTARFDFDADNDALTIAFADVPADDRVAEFVGQLRALYGLRASALAGGKHPNPSALEARVAELDGTISDVLDHRDGGWVVVWHRGWDGSFVTHRVYPHEPAALDHGHYDIPTLDEAVRDAVARGGAR